MIKVYNPVSYLEKKEKVLLPVAFQGKRVAFLSNNKPNVDLLFDQLQNLLLDQFKPASLTRIAKASAAHPAPASMLSELAEKAEVVINGVGD